MEISITVVIELPALQGSALSRDITISSTKSSEPKELVLSKLLETLSIGPKQQKNWTWAVIDGNQLGPSRTKVNSRADLIDQRVKDSVEQDLSAIGNGSVLVGLVKPANTETLSLSFLETGRWQKTDIASLFSSRLSAIALSEKSATNTRGIGGGSATENGVDRFVQGGNEPVIAEIIAGDRCGDSLTLGTGLWRLEGAGTNLELNIENEPQRTTALVLRDAEPVVIALSSRSDEKELTSTKLHRRLRTDRCQKPERLRLANPPAQVDPPQKISWVSVLLPIPFAAIFAVIFAPMFAIFGLIGAVGALGRWAEGRWRYKKDLKGYNKEVARTEQSNQIERARYRKELHAYSWQNQPSVAELFRTASGTERLWERTQSDQDAMVITLGVGTGSVETLGTEIGELAQSVPLGDIPQTLDMGQGLGLFGDREPSVGIARSVICQLATLHGPSTLSFALLSDSSSRSDWEWLKWLPHPVEIIDTSEETEFVDKTKRSLSSQSAREQEVSHRVVLIADGSQKDVAKTLEILETKGRRSSRPTANNSSSSTRYSVLAISEVAHDLCAQAHQQFHCRTHKITPRDTLKYPTLIPSSISAKYSRTWARSLSRFSDVELAAGYGNTAGINDLTLIESFATQGTELPLYRETNRPPSSAGGLKVIIGNTSKGPVEIDFEKDGPHMLVAGTTGSGKSELLRSMVVSLCARYSPDELNLLLADFKGGGALDCCAELAHVCGMITDLEPTQVEKAIESIHQELIRREELLRSCAASSYEQARSVLQKPLPRLMVVIDEFAVLAGQYQSSLDTIIDLASRGRSLGMHLVLATQRPSGVVSAKLRANTNISLALRTVNESDSLDVVGVGDAAYLSRHKPGLGLMSIASDPVISLRSLKCSSEIAAAPAQSLSPKPDNQTAFKPDNQTPFKVEDFTLFDPEPNPAGSPLCPQDTEYDKRYIDELALVVEAVTNFCDKEKYEVRQLWAPPLKTVIGFEEIHTALQPDRLLNPSLFLGLREQNHPEDEKYFEWNYETDSLGIYASSARTRQNLLRSLVAVCADKQYRLAPNSQYSQIQRNTAEVSPIEVLETPVGLVPDIYIIDGSGRLCDLESWGHVGAVIRSDDTERIERLLKKLEAKSTQNSARAQSEPKVKMSILIIESVTALESFGDAVEHGDLITRIASLTRDPSMSRVVLLATAGSVRDIPSRLASELSVRLAMKLSDPHAGLSLGLPNDVLASLPEMRALDIAEATQVQLLNPASQAYERRLKESVEENAAAPIPIIEPELALETLCAPELHLEQIEQGNCVIGINVEDQSTITLCLGEKTAESKDVNKPACVAVVGPANKHRQFLFEHIESSLKKFNEETQGSELISCGDIDQLDQIERNELRTRIETSPNTAVLVACSAETFNSITSPITALRGRLQLIALGSLRSYPQLSARVRESGIAAKSLRISQHQERGIFCDSERIEAAQFIMKFKQLH